MSECFILRKSSSLLSLWSECFTLLQKIHLLVIYNLLYIQCYHSFAHNTQLIFCSLYLINKTYFVLVLCSSFSCQINNFLLRIIMLLSCSISKLTYYLYVVTAIHKCTLQVKVKIGNKWKKQIWPVKNNLWPANFIFYRSRWLVDFRDLFRV